MGLAAAQEIGRPHTVKRIAAVALISLMGSCGLAAEAQTYAARLTLTAPLPAHLGKIPLDPAIDFERLIRDAELPGVLDPNSIVICGKDGRPIPHALTEDFAYGDKGRIEWVGVDPSQREFEVRFDVVPRRPALSPQPHVPMIGTGDLLRYNAGEARPIALPYISGLVDLTGDGRRDLVGCWNYAYRPGWPWDGVICYPRHGGTDAFELGDLCRVRYVEQPDSREFKHLDGIYMHASFADLNGDSLVDLVRFYRHGKRQVDFFLNTGRRDAGGMPVFSAEGGYTFHKQPAWPTPIRAVDLNSDGATDLVVVHSWGLASYLRNTNPEGWPMRFAEPVALKLDRQFDFFDIDGDGRLDSVGRAPATTNEVSPRGLVWRQNLGGAPPAFAAPLPLRAISVSDPTFPAAVREGPRRGLLVRHGDYQRVSFCEYLGYQEGEAKFKLPRQAQSVSAVMSLGDQASPCACDWDHDGDWDLLVGGGYGWPRILINHGSNAKPMFGEALPILSEGKPIRILRDDVLGGRHPHNMGYLYPIHVDWDMDGLPDLVIPNETNRIFWYRNIGALTRPAFGPRQQILVDGFPDSPEMRLRSNRLAADYKHTPNAPYPFEESRPFAWRHRAAVLDLNGDGLVDLVTHDGQVPQRLMLFARYRDEEGRLGLRRDRLLLMTDGREITKDTVLGRDNPRSGGHAVFTDWDGDGLQDIVYSLSGWPREGSLYLLRHAGTRTHAVFELPRPLFCFGEPIFVTRHGPHPWVGDMNDDGKPDILCYTEWSVYPFYSHAALEMKARPAYTLGPIRKHVKELPDG